VKESLSPRWQWGSGADKQTLQLLQKLDESDPSIITVRIYNHRTDTFFAIHGMPDNIKEEYVGTRPKYPGELSFDKSSWSYTELGRLLGKNASLKYLHIEWESVDLSLFGDFLHGMKDNESIEEVYFTSQYPMAGPCCLLCVFETLEQLATGGHIK
jgi:hypothetical protein